MSKLYDRQYRVIVTFLSGQSVNVADLRCTFNFSKSIAQQGQYGEVTIYNLSPNTQTDLFFNAKEVTVEAGYRNGVYGVIFQGKVRQPIQGKENGTDYYISLGAIDGDDSLNLAFAETYIGAGQLPAAIARQIARSSSVNFELKFRGDLGGEATERGKTIFGQPKEMLQSLATNNGAAFYVDNGTVYIDKLIQPPPASVPELNYQTGMIGTPTQQDNGVSVNCLIRPDIQLGTWVKLNNANIILANTPFRGGLNPNVIDLDGLYRVIEIQATGDTRGNEWYYGLKLLAQNGELPAALVFNGQYGY